MEKLKVAILPNIATISIGLGVFGVFMHLIGYSVNSDSRWVFNLFSPAHFEDYLWILLSKRHSISVYISPVTLLFFVMLIIGGLLYRQTEGKDARLLRFGYAVIFIQKLLLIPQLFLNYKLYHRLHEMHPELDQRFLSITPFIGLFLMALPFLFFAYFITRWLTDLQKMNVQYEENEYGTKAVDYLPLSKGKRFGHLVFDFILMIFIVSPLLFSLMQYVGDSNSFLAPWQMGISPATSLWLIAALSLYYLLFEGFFNATPAKFITGSRVLDSWTLGKPTFGQILWRTLARRIPFETFSFLGKNGWHDSLTKTAVVQEENYGQSRSYHRWWAWLLIGLYVLPFSSRYIQQELTNRKESKLFNDANLKTNEALLASLDIGDAIMTRPHGSYSEPSNVLVIEKSTPDSLHCLLYNLPESKNYYRYTKDSLFHLINGASTLQFLDEVSFSKQSLHENWLNRGKGDFYLEDSKFELVNIFSHRHPEIIGAGASYSYNDNSFTGVFSFRHDLFPIEIVRASMTEGDAVFLSPFPMNSTFFEQENKGVFKLELDNLKEGVSFKADLALQYNGSVHAYILEGVGNQIKIYRQLK